MAKVIDSFLFSELERSVSASSHHSDTIRIFIIKTSSGISVLLKQTAPALVVNYFNISNVCNGTLHSRIERTQYPCMLCQQESAYTLYIGQTTKELLKVETEIGPITEKPNKTIFCQNCRSLLQQRIQEWVNNNPQVLIAEYI